MKQNRESIEEYQRVLKEYYQSKRGPKKDGELEFILKKDVVTAINMCIALNKRHLITDLGKILLQTVTHNFWDLDVSFREIESQIMEEPFDKQEKLTIQKTEKDFAKEKIVRAIEVCHKNLPEDMDLIYKLAILLTKVDFLNYKFIKRGLGIIQKKYLARLDIQKKHANAIKQMCKTY